MVLFKVGGYYWDSRQGSSHNGVSFIYASAIVLISTILVLLLRNLFKIVQPKMNLTWFCQIAKCRISNKDKFSSMNSTLIFFKYVAKEFYVFS